VEIVEADWHILVIGHAMVHDSLAGNTFAELALQLYSPDDLA
jgi:hypothetical protein